MNWPSWWEWELGFTSHVEVRMEERGFSEVELRVMLDGASKLSLSPLAGEVGGLFIPVMRDIPGCRARSRRRDSYHCNRIP